LEWEIKVNRLGGGRGKAFSGIDVITKSGAGRCPDGEDVGKKSWRKWGRNKKQKEGSKIRYNCGRVTKSFGKVKA